MAIESGPIILVVLDGFGVSLETRGNPIAQAKLSTLAGIESSYPFTTLQASGTAVGLPWGEPGNSEVGHLTMGAGRPIYHHLPRIENAIHDGSFYQNPAFLKAVAHVRQTNSSLHLIGLVSSGSVHSYIDHLYALIELAKREGLARVWIHVITDGKDAPPDEGARFLAHLTDRIHLAYPMVAVASLIGRDYAMDRDEKWDRIQKTYELLFEAQGRPMADPVQALKDSYAKGVLDEFVEPMYLERDGKTLGRITSGDSVILFNFREDSMRELAQALAKEPFEPFNRALPQNLKVVTMTQYLKTLPQVSVAFPPLEVTEPLARVLAESGKTQLHIAETEKYAHVTYFFNGGTEKPFPNEDRVLVPSAEVAHFDEKPEMMASEIAVRIIQSLARYDFILANFANADMVGHTGNFNAVIQAVETLDQVLGELISAVFAKKGTLIITSDHGNAERKRNPISGEPLTEHTANPVPFYLVDESRKLKDKRSKEEILALKREPGGILTDVAPTILELMHLPKPAEMTGRSLLGILAGDNRTVKQ